MKPKEKIAVWLTGLVITGAVAYLLLFAPIGSLGSLEGQSFEVDRFGIIGYIVLLLIGGYFLVRDQGKKL